MVSPVAELVHGNLPKLESLGLINSLDSAAVPVLSQGRWPLLTALYLTGIPLEDGVLHDPFTGQWLILEKVYLTLSSCGSGSRCQQLHLLIQQDKIKLPSNMFFKVSDLIWQSHDIVWPVARRYARGVQPARAHQSDQATAAQVQRAKCTCTSSETSVPTTQYHCSGQ